MPNHTNYKIQSIGKEQEPIVIIDDFFSVPDKLVDIASQSSFIDNSSHYPGIRAEAPSSYLAERQDLLVEIIQTQFGITTGVDVLECNYSLVTFQPAKLSMFQCFPHFDGLERGRLAILHYLCDENFGGTAFYRHKATGYETLNSERYQKYDLQRQAEFKKAGLSEKKYFSGNSNEFEEIANIKAKFNRLVIYRGCSIHSGQIPQNFAFSPDPKKGRLTINTFFMEKTLAK